MPHDPHQPGPGLVEFLTERHLATLTTLRADGSPHVRKDPRAPQPSRARAGTLHGGHADAVERYARRYRQPRPDPARVVIEISVDRILGNA